MGSFDRSKKSLQVWKKALIHFSLCFIMGFFTGLAPTSSSPGEISELGNFNRSLMALQNNSGLLEEESELIPRKLLIIITARTRSRLDDTFLVRLVNTLKMVPPPVLWIVGDCHLNPIETSMLLRNTGIMYRHVVCKENFEDPSAELDHLRNAGLTLVEKHRINGIVHFAAPSNVYDLQFFEEIREIEVYGAWPVGLVSANRQRVVVEGPVCDSSRVTGWHMRDGNRNRRFPMNIAGFGFNSSILWDPERWGRLSSVQDASQDSLSFVRQVIMEDGIKVKGIPEGCSKVMIWHLYVPRSFFYASILSNRTQ